MDGPAKAGCVCNLNRRPTHTERQTGEEGDSCWYSALRHDGRCRERFDFADHGVLFISQYLTIQTFETLAVLREVRGSVGGRVGWWRWWLYRLSHTSVSVRSFSSVRLTNEHHQKQASNPLHLLACLAAACLISLASLLGFYATVSFFHTRIESAVALLLCACPCFVLFCPIPGVDAVYTY